MQNNEKKVTHISVPQWMKQETPLIAQFCELVNFALESDPTMSLAAFAKILHGENVRATDKRLEAVEERQFGTDEEVTR